MLFNTHLNFKFINSRYAINRIHRTFAIGETNPQPHPKDIYTFSLLRTLYLKDLKENILVIVKEEMALTTSKTEKAKILQQYKTYFLNLCEKDFQVAFKDSHESLTTTKKQSLFMEINNLFDSCVIE